MIPGQRLFDNSQLTGYAIHHLDRIITHFLIDGKPDTPLTVDADDIIGTRILKLNGSDFPKEKRSLVCRRIRPYILRGIRCRLLLRYRLIADDQIFKISLRAEQTGTFYQILQSQLADTAAGYTLVVRLDTGGNIFYLQSESIQFIRIGLYDQGIFLLAGQSYFSNAF